MDIYCW